MAKKLKKSEENPQAFKHWIGPALLKKLSKALTQAWPQFDQKRFMKLAPRLQSLELKPRVQLIRDELHAQLPKEFPVACQILLKSLKSGDLKGFDLWPYTEFVQTYGLDHPEISMGALKELTQVFTSEFAVRPFINKYPKQTLKYLLNCAKDPNVHLRRWASEGSRPRLPWGEKLNIVIQDPGLTLPILERLKYDEELYVRKSVSNHLNDFTKDHPDLVLKTLKEWKVNAPKKHLPKVDWIINRSLRSLIKAGHPKALKLIGVSESKIKVSPLRLKSKKLKLNDRMEFDFQLESTSSKPQKIVVDYVVHFKKSNGTNSAKVFKLKTFNLEPKAKIQIEKSHHLKKVTTRKHYPGEHLLAIQINGKTYGQLKWKLE